jgi:hypothetical protein
MLKETKTTTQSKIPFLWLQSLLPIHKRESRKKVGLLGCSEASEHSRTGTCFVNFTKSKILLGFQRAIQCGGFWGFRFFWVTSKEVPRVDSRKSPVEVKKSKPSKIYLAL